MLKTVILTAAVVAAPALAQPRVPLKFPAGASQTTVTGTLKGMEKRTYVLQARNGQQLEAELSSDNTGVRFGDNGTALGYQTTAGPNYVYIWNNGRATTNYKLKVSIR